REHSKSSYKQTKRTTDDTDAMDRKVPKHESRIDARRPAGAPLSVPSVLLTVAIFACRADCQSGKDEEEPRLRKTKNLHFHAASLFIRAYWCQFVGLPGKKNSLPTNSTN